MPALAPLLGEADALAHAVKESVHLEIFPRLQIAEVIINKRPNLRWDMVNSLQASFERADSNSVGLGVDVIGADAAQFIPPEAIG